MVATVVMKFLFTHCEFQQDQTDIVWDWLRGVATHKVTKSVKIGSMMDLGTSTLGDTTEFAMIHMRLAT